MHRRYRHILYDYSLDCVLMSFYILRKLCKLKMVCLLASKFHSFDLYKHFVHLYLSVNRHLLIP